MRLLAPLFALVFTAGSVHPPAPLPEGPAESHGVVSSVVAVLPVPGPVVGRFHPPPSPYGAGHRGVDLAAEAGVVVRSALPGRVQFAGPVALVGWVTVRHSDRLETTYGPLEPIDVAAGIFVSAGQPLGRLAPGAAHLDWGARLDGAYIDPLSLLGRWRAHLVAW